MESQPILFSAELAKHLLYLSAFPLLTGLYGYRGLQKGAVSPSKVEIQASKKLNVSVDALNACYSLLIPLGFVLTKKAALSLGLVTLGFCTSMGLKPEQDLHVPEVLSFFETASDVGHFIAWASGVLGFGALGIWCYRRYQSGKKRIIGVPEVGLAIFIPTFAYWWPFPSDYVLKQLIYEHISTCDSVTCAFQ